MLSVKTCPLFCPLVRNERDKSLNPVQNERIFDFTVLTGFADNKSDVADMTMSVFDKVEKIVGKGKKIAGYHHFFHITLCFRKPSLLGLSKSGLSFNPLPSDKILNLSKLKTHADRNEMLCKL